MQDFLNYLRYELSRSEHTIAAYRRDLEQFIAFGSQLCGKTQQDSISKTPALNPATSDTQLIRRWIASLAEAGDAPASLRRKTQSLRAYFRFLCRRGVLKVNPADSIVLAKLPKPLPDFVRAEDMQRLIGNDSQPRKADSEDINNSSAATSDFISARDHIILHLLYATGLRRSELLSLTDKDIYISGKQMKIFGKGRKERIVPIADQLIEDIKNWQRIRDDALPDLQAPRPIIATRHGRMSESSIELIIKRLLKSENAGRKSPHTLRHSFATAMLNGGADLNSVRAILGHSSLATTQKYTHLQFSDIKDIYEKSHPRARNTSGGPKKSESDEH